MMLDTASSTPRMMARFSWPENPSDSISGSSAPRTTHRNVGWLRKSSFNKNDRVILGNFVFPCELLAAIDSAPWVALPPPSAIDAGVMGKNHSLALRATNFL